MLRITPHFTTTHLKAMITLHVMIIFLFGSTAAMAGYTDVIRNDEPLGYFRMNETIASGDLVSSTIGAGAIHDASVSEPGPVVGNWWAGHGSGGLAEVAGVLADDAAVRFTTIRSSAHASTIASGIPLSMEAWFLIDPDSGDLGGTVVSLGELYVLADLFDINVDNGLISVHLRNQYSQSNPVGTTFVADGIWHHVVLVLEEGLANTTKATLYLDGDPNPEIEIETSQGWNDSVDTFVIGGRCTYGTGSDFLLYRGSIDEVAIYDYALSYEQIFSHYEEAVGAKPSANAGQDQTHIANSSNDPVTVSLDGSASTAGREAIIEYLWIDGGVEIATGQTATVSLPVGTHYLTLTVIDADGLYDIDTVCINILDGSPKAPVADAGADQIIYSTLPPTVTLDGSGSTDIDGTIVSYQWSINGATIASGQTPQVVLNEGIHIVTLTVTDSDSITDSDTVEIIVTLDHSVAGRHIFYNNSIFDNNDPAANIYDDAAIATDKIAFKRAAGLRASFENYTSYALGINGIMIDIYNVPAIPVSDDFRFRTGNDDDPELWVDAPEPISITLRAGQGSGGSDRITILWGDNAIEGQWLRVDVLPTDATGIATADTFYFGNAIGESGNSPIDTIVGIDDKILPGQNPCGFTLDDFIMLKTHYGQRGVLWSQGDYNSDGIVNLDDFIILKSQYRSQAAIDNLYDYNRDRAVNALDMDLAGIFATGPGESLILLNSGDLPDYLPLTNRKSGISVGLSGINGLDWAVENTYHDGGIGDQIIYVRSSAEFSLAHNENNVIMKRLSTPIPYVLGVNGPDGISNSGDEGVIYYKIDRDGQAHHYTQAHSLTMQSWTPAYTEPFTFDELSYDGSMPVLGSIGDNGGLWGDRPLKNTERFAYGQADSFGNQWHTLTYWDDDVDIYNSYGDSYGRIACSDGHALWICVNPVTPVIQLSAPDGEQFYTTPVKTYFSPRIFDQTSYLTDGVRIAFVNMTNSEPTYYRVNGGAWQRFYTSYLRANDLFDDRAESVLEVKAGVNGAILERTVVMNPDHPAPGEEHGYLLWSDESERQATITRLANTQPFKQSYITFKNSYYQASLIHDSSDRRLAWRDGSDRAQWSLANAFIVALEGPNAQAELAVLAKNRLLRLARQVPVGYEEKNMFSSPTKDYLSELGQVIQVFGDAAVAYDMLAGSYRSSDHPEGITPIEEYCIRDGLAEIAKSTLQFRDNWNFNSGAGSTHWAMGYEHAVIQIALAMPSYSTPYFGVSGADGVSVNTYADANGEYWNPYPYQGATWYAAATDSMIDFPGYPDINYPTRTEALLSDNGFWTGPNYLSGDGSRSPVMDIYYVGLGNARVELVENTGYEVPFTNRIAVVDCMRRIAGDNNRQTSVSNYIRRRMMYGYILQPWDSASKTYGTDDARIDMLAGYNNHYEFTGLDEPLTMLDNYLTNVNRFYGYESGTYPSYISEDAYKYLFNAYALAMCLTPDEIAAPVTGVNHAPIIKPMLKYVVAPGDTIVKTVIAQDLDGDDLTVSVTNLPIGATYDPVDRIITWTPASDDTGVHFIDVTASDTSEPSTGVFPVIVATSPAKPEKITELTATLQGNDAHLTWDAAADAAWYVVYREGLPVAYVPAGTLGYIDTDLPGGSLTRYYVSVLNSDGGESTALASSPEVIVVPRD